MLKVLLDEGTSVAPPKRPAQIAPSQSGSDSGIASAAVEPSSTSVVAPTSSVIVPAAAVESTSISVIVPALESSISSIALAADDFNIPDSADAISQKGIQVGYYYIYIY